jgi:hypothetical protein
MTLQPPTRRMKSLYALLFCLLLVACQTTVWQVAFAPPGQVLFKEDFSDPASGWPRRETEEGQMDYFGGAYRIIVRRADYHLWALAGAEQYTDIRLEVDAAPLSGPLENRFGLLCRHRDPNNFYFFVISADGYYGLGKVKDGIPALFGQEMMTANPAIVRGFAANHLRLDCVGDALTAYVNGQPVALAHDTDLPDGRAGLLAGTFHSVNVDVVFDNFQIIKP